ncbi:MAG: class II aldolase/adducin family protein [Planctomycetota bacterium]
MPKKKYQDVYEEFKKIGQAIFLAGLNNSHSGNMSLRIGDQILITRRGSMLGFLKDTDIIKTGLSRNDSGVALASSELGIHRAILNNTSALAVVHTHPLTATALSLVMPEIIAIDVEGSYYFRKIPVLSFEFGSASKEMEEKLPVTLKNYKSVMVKGHGAFSIGQTLEEAFQYAHITENIAQIIYRAKVMGADLSQLQNAKYLKW